MTPKEYKTATNMLTFMLGNALPVTDDEESLIAYYMLSTGYEVYGDNGKKLDIPFSGLFMGELTEALVGEKSRLHKLLDKNATLTKSSLSPYQKFIKNIYFTGEHLDPLLEFAYQDPIAWEAVKKLAALFLKEKRSLPDNLRLFAIATMEQDPPSGKRGKNAYLHLLRNATIVNCMMAMEKNGFGPTTKSSEDSSTLSLCDAVEKALKILGIHLTYGAVKKIYKQANSLKGKICAFHLTLESKKKPIA